ncbi:MAG: hypothetical protein M1839_007137 [Geoglossum umbratile]|nr:MAG: hypothetical protein M1839_007137 [Geoglossum umbratile]
MSLQGRGQFDVVGEKIRDSETGIDTDDTQRPRHSGASIAQGKWSAFERHSADIMWLAARLATTREEQVLEKVHDETMSPIIPPSLEKWNPNGDDRQGLASQAPQTPNRSSPNIGRKRSQNPALLRAAASPGHSVKMAQIFHDAQTSLRNDLQPPVLAIGRHPRKSRLPVLQRRVAGRSLICYVEGQNIGKATTAAAYASETMSVDLDAQTKQLPSFGRTTTPSRAITSKTYYEAPHDLCFPMSDTGHRHRPKESTDGNFSIETNEVSLDDELVVSKGSTRGKVPANESTPPNPGTANPDFDIWDDEDDSELYFAQRSIALPTPMTSRELFTPGADRSNVDKWLEDMLSASPRKKWRVPVMPGSDSSLQTRFFTESRGKARAASQGYETVLRPSDDGIDLPDTDMGPEESDKENQKPSDERAIDKYFEPQPRESLQSGNAATPYKSRIPTLGENPQIPVSGSPFRLTHYATPRGYFLETPRRRKLASKDTAPTLLHGVEEVVKLSPDVDRYRKANRPRRERCASYYDDDIIGPLEERGVLTESNMSRRLTRAMAFCEEAEDFEFTGVEPCE